MNDILFENEYELTKQFLRGRAKLSQKRDGKLPLWVALCLIIFNSVNLFILAITFMNIIPRIITIIIALLLLVFPYYILPVIQHRQYAKRAGEKSSTYSFTRKVSFGESILIQTGNSIVTYSYDKVRYIDKNDEYIYFWINDTIVSLCMKSFTIGNPNDFLAFFYKKCSEQNSLWSKKELNRHDFVEMLPYIVFFTALAFVTYVIFRLPHQELVYRIIQFILRIKQFTG